MERAFDYIELTFESLTADFFAIWFLVGAAIFLVGLLLVGLFTLSRLTGYRTAGRIIGAVNVIRSKTRERNGEIVQIEKKSLFPVYEYQASDGSVRQMRGSEGGTMVHGYTTGASVNLIVREDSGYDDVYDADQRGALYVGMGFVAAGVGMMIAVGSIASAFGVTLLACAVAVAIRMIGALSAKQRKPIHQRRKRMPYSKSFEPDDLRPIESFASVQARPE